MRDAPKFQLINKERILTSISPFVCDFIAWRYWLLAPISRIKCSIKNKTIPPHSWLRSQRSFPFYLHHSTLPTHHFSIFQHLISCVWTTHMHANFHSTKSSPKKINQVQPSWILTKTLPLFHGSILWSYLILAPIPRLKKSKKKNTTKERLINMIWECQLSHVQVQGVKAWAKKYPCKF